VNVQYLGDSTYGPSSTVVPVTMLNMFSMTVASPVSFAAGAATGNTSALTVTPLNGFTGPIYLACTIAYYPPGAQHLPTCSVPASVSVTSAAAVASAMTISSTGPTTVSRAQIPPGPALPAGRYLALFACVFGLVFPWRRRIRLYRTGLCLLVLLAGSLTLVSCGGTQGHGGGGGGKTVPGTTPGTYKFMVDGAYTQNQGTTQPFFSSQPQVFVVNVNIQ
jgi:hypothetical protein